MTVFIKWNDPCVRLTGRWSRLEEDSTNPYIYMRPTAQYTTTTAPGSYFEIAWQGRQILLHFDLGYLGKPYPHLWLQVDDGALVEVPLDRHIRIDGHTDGKHIAKVLYKGGMEMLPRWYPPLMGAVSFIGADADAPGELLPDKRKIIEFIGDSITEGVSIDVDYYHTPGNLIDQFNRVYQDDNLATYAAITAQRLNLRPIFQAYGAVGITRAGCGSVPRAGLIYPYVFDGVPYTGEKPDIVVINHGTNDRAAAPGEFIQHYAELVDMIRENTPEAIIVCLTPFVGAYNDEIGNFVESYNRSHEKGIHYVSTKGWIEPEPLHPLRSGHLTVADNFTPILKDILKSSV